MIKDLELLATVRFTRKLGTSTIISLAKTIQFVSANRGKKDRE